MDTTNIINFPKKTQKQPANTSTESLSVNRNILIILSKIDNELSFEIALMSIRSHCPISLIELKRKFRVPITIIRKAVQELENLGLYRFLPQHAS